MPVKSHVTARTDNSWVPEEAPHRPKFGAYPGLRTFQSVVCGHVMTIEIEE
jgi:hypothetical protein